MSDSLTTLLARGETKMVRFIQGYRYYLSLTPWGTGHRRVPCMCSIHAHICELLMSCPPRMPVVAHLQSWELVPLRLIFEKEKRHGDLASPHYTRDNKEEEKEPGIPC